MNTTHTLELRGCAPTPLASYLKALGILRLVSEQADSTACGWWKNDTFYLRSNLNREELMRFFLESYSPTPLVGPWGARSGFFPSTSEKSAREALDQIVNSEQDRLDLFRTAVGEVRLVLESLGLEEKADSDDEKLMLLRKCRAELSDELLVWLDAVYVLLNEGRAFPPLLGTGGNEGSGSYMSGFAQQVVAVIVNREWDLSLAPAVFGTIAAHVGDKQTPGHFSPDAAGGPNASAGFDGSVHSNPWDYLLALEGTLLFASSAVKRLESHGDGTLAYPFCVRSIGIGYASSDLSDEGPARAEMWFPLWNHPASLLELTALLNEGRASVNQRKVRSGTDFARAVASLGTDRGVSQFERYGFQQRNGLSYFAIPLGRFHVPKAEIRSVALLDPLDNWLDRFRRAANGKTSPARARRALRLLESAIMKLCRRGDASDVQAVLLALGEAEATIAVSKSLREGDMGSGLNPVPALVGEWLVVANDQSSEFRLAASLASVAHDKVGPFRRHLEPIDPLSWKSRFPKWSKTADDPGIVWGGGSLVQNLNAVLDRRLIEVLKEGKQQTDAELYAPLHGRCHASLGDIARFIDGLVDDRRIESLLRGLMLVNWPSVKPEHRQVLLGPELPLPKAAYALLKLCNLPYTLDNQPIKLTPRIARRAIVGDGAEASRLAARRLLASGVESSVDVVGCTRDQSRRLAAALVFPISKTSARQLRSRIHHQQETTTSVEQKGDEAVT